jgi:hypothetical protein
MIPLIGMWVFSFAPMCIPDGPCVGTMIVGLFVIWFAVFAVVGVGIWYCRGWRSSSSCLDYFLGAISAAWVVGEGLFGLGLGAGLQVHGSPSPASS